MANLAKFAFRRGPTEYELQLSWDDAAFAAGDISFEVTASQMTVDAPTSKRSASASVSVERGDDNEPMLVLKIGPHEQRWKLRELFEESQLLDKIPAVAYGLGDPFTGCLMRSGLSVVVAQIIECKNSSAGIAWFVPRARAMGSCLKEQIPSMCGKAAFRAARCIMVAGAA